MELGDQVNLQRIHKVRKRKKGKDGELKKDSYGVSAYRPQYLGKPETPRKGHTTVSTNLNIKHNFNHQHCKQQRMVLSIGCSIPDFTDYCYQHTIIAGYCFNKYTA
jgi:hypothetical protein